MDEQQWIIYEPFLHTWIAFFSERDANAYRGASFAILQSNSPDVTKRYRLSLLLDSLRHKVRFDLPEPISIDQLLPPR